MKILNWIDKYLEITIMQILMWGIVIVMSIQVFMRYVIGSSLAWSEEISRYFFIWTVFLGISYCIFKKTHIRVDILETIYPILKKPFEYISDIAFLFFMFYMINPSLEMVKRIMQSGQTTPALELPMFYVYLSLFVGFVLTILRIIRKYVLKIVDISNIKSKESKE